MHKTCEKTPKRELLRRNIDMSTVRIMCYSDISSANNADSSTQLGYCIFLVDHMGKSTWIHFISYKSKRVLRSILGGQTYVFVDAFDVAYKI